MRRQLIPALLSMVLFTLLLGVGYPLVVTGIAQVGLQGQGRRLVRRARRQAGGLVPHRPVVHRQEGQPDQEVLPVASVGSDRRSGTTAAGYDPTLSLGSNLGPTNPELLKLVSKRVKDYRELNGLASNVLVPVDAVTASASGLDPDISIANARLQAPRSPTSADSRSSASCA